MYYNKLGMADKYVSYWQKVADTLSQNKYVVGYDPFNEPFTGWDGLADAANTLWPGHFDRYKLAPLYTRLNEKF